MAKVQAQVAGGSIKQIAASTVRDAKAKMNCAGYTATVNGDPADDSYELSDFEFVALAKPVKAGL